MSHHLYQLKVDATPGEIVRIDGPWDTWGVVRERRPTGFHLIRGLGHTRPSRAPHNVKRTK